MSEETAVASAPTKRRSTSVSAGKATTSRASKPKTDKADAPTKVAVQRKPPVRKSNPKPAVSSSENRSSTTRQNNNSNKQNNNSSTNNNHRRQRRSYSNQGSREMQPSVSRDDLMKLKVVDLRAKATELNIDGAGLKKADLVEAVFSASVKAEGFIEVSGILDILADGYGFLRTQGYLPSEADCYVGLSTIRRNGLRKGDLVAGQTRPARENEKYAAIQTVTAINGKPIEECSARTRFADLTPDIPV